MKADLYSLGIYIGSIFLSLILCKWGENRRPGSLLKTILIAFIVSFPLSLVAGLRYDVGTDYMSYFRDYTILGEESWLSVITNDRGGELGFRVIYKICYIFAGPIPVLFFFTVESLTLMFAYLGFLRIKQHCGLNVTLAFFLFFLLFYSHSLNGLRQVLAIGVLVYACGFLLEKRFVAFYATLFLAFLFHKSSIICGVYPLVMFLTNGANKKGCNVKVILFYFLSVCSIMLIKPLLDILLKTETFESYNTYDVNSNAGISIGMFIYFFIFIVPYAKKYKRNIESSNELMFLQNLSFLYIPICFIGFMVEWASRLNWYTEAIFIIFTCMLSAKMKRNAFVNVYAIVVYVLYYIYIFCIVGQSEVFPYRTFAF